MKLFKNIERSGKGLARSITKRFIRPPEHDAVFDRDVTSKILLVRQDTRLGNLVLMTPMIAAFRAAFPDANIDVLISAGMEDVLKNNPDIDELLIFDKKTARMNPLNYSGFIRSIRSREYDLAVDVSDGRHFSFNNVITTALSGARCRLGYDREDAADFFDLLVPPPLDEMHFADALTGLVKAIVPDAGEHPMRFHVSDDDRAAVDGIIEENGLSVLDSFCLVHPGGRGKKQWGESNFAELIDRIVVETGIPVMVIGGTAEDEIIKTMSSQVSMPFPVVQGLSIGRMAALIERCDIFVSNDTGPMHVASALGRCTVAVFVSSNYRQYGPRGSNTRIVAGKGDRPPVADVLMAINDLLKSCAS